MNKDKRELNVIFAKGGSGSTSCKLSLPMPWVKALGLDADHRVVVAALEGDRIVISKK